jgi:hypothetical protein
VKIRLERIGATDQPAVSTVRDWPAVPRIGEHIEININGKPVTGMVRIVLWGDDNPPLVRFR